jgi:hypothetical protein
MQLQLALRSGLTRACSRQAERALASAPAAPSASALRNEGLCGRKLDGLQLMRISLGGHQRRCRRRDHDSRRHRDGAGLGGEHGQRHRVQPEAPLHAREGILR